MLCYGRRRTALSTLMGIHMDAVRKASRVAASSVVLAISIKALSAASQCTRTDRTPTRADAISVAPRLLLCPARLFGRLGRCLPFLSLLFFRRPLLSCSGTGGLRNGPSGVEVCPFEAGQNGRHRAEESSLRALSSGQPVSPVLALRLEPVLARALLTSALLLLL